MIHRVEELYVFDPNDETEQYSMLINHLTANGCKYELYLSPTSVMIIVCQDIKEDWPTVRSNG